MLGPHPLGARRFAALARGLPSSGAVARSIGDGWTLPEHLAVTQLELMHAHYRATLAAAGVKKLPEQLHVPRAGDEAPERRPTTLADIRAVLRGDA